MTTLPLHAPTPSRLTSLPHAVFTRILSFVLNLIDVFEEAQNQAREAERRHHFTDY